MSTSIIQSLPVELFLAIIWWLPPLGHYKMALVCRAWSDAAIDTLWSTAEIKLQDLLRVLAPIVVVIDGIEFCAEPPMDPQRQSRFIRLARQVKYLLLDTQLPSSNSIALLKSLLEPTGETVLCSNATTFQIYVEPWGDWDVSRIAALVGPKVTRLILPTQCGGVKLRAIGAACPNVTNLSTAADDDNRLFGPFRHLRWLRYQGEPLGEPEWRQIPEAYPFLAEVEYYPQSQSGRVLPLLDRPFEWNSIKSLSFTFHNNSVSATNVIQVAKMPKLEALQIFGPNDGKNIHWPSISSNLQLNSPKLRTLYLVGPGMPKGNWGGFKDLRHLSLRSTRDGSFNMNDADVAEIVRGIPALETLKVHHLFLKGHGARLEYMRSKLDITPTLLVTLAALPNHLTDIALIMNASRSIPELATLHNTPNLAHLKTLSLVVTIPETEHPVFASFIKAICPELSKFRVEALERDTAYQYAEDQVMWRIGERLAGLEGLVLGTR